MKEEIEFKHKKGAIIFFSYSKKDSKSSIHILHSCLRNTCGVLPGAASFTVFYRLEFYSEDHGCLSVGSSHRYSAWSLYARNP